ncbi:MAG: DUF1461 domain-containing protein [Dehalococcoidia bacterium]|nr:DUF1461 domain-containing protein [Dehalococcoidia bacterium]
MFFVFILAVPIFCLLSVTRFLVLMPSTYEQALIQGQAELVTGISLDQLSAVNREIRNYLLGFTDAPLWINVVTNEGASLSIFNDREVNHMVDVRNLMQLFWKIHEGLFILILSSLTISFIAFRDDPLLKIATDVRAASLTGIGLFVILATLIFTGFDSAFYKFHELMFTNDLWILNESTDRLLQMYPRDFWYWVTFRLAVVTSIVIVLMFGLSQLYLKIRKSESSSRSESITRWLN